MSTAASFWAAKSGDVKSLMPRAHEPVRAAGQARKSSTTVNGTTGTPPCPKSQSSHETSPGGSTIKTSWVDSDNESEYPALASPPRRVKELESTVSAKDSQLIDTTMTLQEKNAKIIELEVIVESQQTLIISAQATTEASTKEVEELKKENHKQFLHIQKLVADVDEKDRRVAVLEVEVDEHCATIATLDERLQKMETESVLQQEQHTVEGLKKDGPEAAMSLQEQHMVGSPQKDEAESTLQHEQHMVEGLSKEEAKSDVPDEHQTVEEVKTIDTAPVQSVDADLAKPAGPAVNTSEFPVYSTTATIKQIAAPPPAPKLRMAVDMSEYAKKRSPATIVKPTVTEKQMDKATPVVGNKDLPAPKIDIHSDIRSMPFHQRALFANGSTVQVKMDDVTLTTLPKYLLMQCLNRAFKHFTDSPKASTLDFPPNSMHPAATAKIFKWMEDMAHRAGNFSMSLYHDDKADEKNLHICRAARVLGLHNMYVGHFTRTYCDRIHVGIDIELMSKMVELAYPENDPIYKCLADNIAYHRYRGDAKEPETLNLFLGKHADLKDRVKKMEMGLRKK
ncbi:hypothetical protein G6514_009617 [Epicoccum nigrum]|nr:hypothetical protein G6514_009617 [Epicoccum nigrum]